jgi:uncharacterized membrane protein
MDYHPIIVHFPITLILTSLFFDLLGLLKPKTSLGDLALYLFIPGVLSTILAGVTGHQAAHRIPQHMQPFAPLDQHASWANATIWFSIALLMLRLHPRFHHSRLPWVRFLFLLMHFLLGITISITGYLGGVLVYQHGIGVITTRY